MNFTLDIVIAAIAAVAVAVAAFLLWRHLKGKKDGYHGYPETYAPWEEDYEEEDAAEEFEGYHGHHAEGYEDVEEDYEDDAEEGYEGYEEDAEEGYEEDAEEEGFAPYAEDGVEGFADLGDLAAPYEPFESYEPFGQNLITDSAPYEPFTLMETAGLADDANAAFPDPGLM